MHKISLIKTNILKFIEYQGITKYEFYKKTGITRGVLDKNTGMSEENTAKFLAYYSNVSPKWLLFGIEPMLIENGQNLDYKPQTDSNTKNENAIYRALEEMIVEKDARIAELNKTIAMQQDFINHLKKTTDTNTKQQLSGSTEKKPKSTHQP